MGSRFRRPRRAPRDPNWGCPDPISRLLPPNPAGPHVLCTHLPGSSWPGLPACLRPFPPSGSLLSPQPRAPQPVSLPSPVRLSPSRSHLFPFILRSPAAHAPRSHPPAAATRRPCPRAAGTRCGPPGTPAEPRSQDPPWPTAPARCPHAASPAPAGFRPPRRFSDNTVTQQTEAIALRSRWARTPA